MFYGKPEPERALVLASCLASVVKKLFYLGPTKALLASLFRSSKDLSFSNVLLEALLLFRMIV
jgi:hypothetical protein